MKKVLIISCTIIALFTSCGKDKTTTTVPETTTQKVQHKWNLVSIKDIQYVGSSTTVVDTIVDYGVAGDYFDFNANNKVYVRIAGFDDTLQYAVLSDSKILLDGDTLTINNLSSSDMKMTYYGRETSPVNNWDNVIILNR